MITASELPSRVFGGIKRAFGQFLALPLAVVIAFLVMTVVIYWADEAWSQGHVPAGFSWVGQLLGDSTALSSLLATVASSIITVTSITFSLLLIALQQGSSALTTQVTDQFLMRRMNQFYFGFFVGLSVFVLLSLVTSSGIHRPVFGTTIALIFTTIALCMIVVMIYNTIDQMRPTQIVRAIHRHVLRARICEAGLLAATRRAPRPGWQVVATIRSPEAGHIVAIDCATLRRAFSGSVEVEMLVPVGRYVAFRDPVVALRAAPDQLLDAVRVAALEASVLGALAFDDDRELRRDPAYGLFQLSTIAWTSISTAKSNPSPGQAVIQSLRDIVARWAAEGEVAADETSPIVYADRTPDEAMDALELIVLATSESMQAQTLADALRTLAILIPSVPAAWSERLADVARRALSSLGEHALTQQLERALHDLALALDDGGFESTGTEVRGATRELATTLGALNSRSTRVPSKA